MMKRIVILSLTLLFLCLASYGQKRSTGQRHKKPVKKTVVKTDAKEPTPQKIAKRFFEGTLMYASMEYHSAATQRYSYGQAYNGTRTQNVTVSGNKMHVIDENVCIHKIYDGDANICYVYSDLTNTGVSFPLNDYMDLYSHFANDSKYYTFAWVQPGHVNYKGDALDTYHASLTSKSEGATFTGSLELWSSSAFYVSDIMKSLLNGAETKGLLKKYVYETKGKVPIIGTLHSIVSAELVALREYHVSKDEFRVPDDVKIIADNIQSCKELNRMYKAHKKAMKKAKLIVNDYAENVLPQISKEWTFVQAVEQDERYTGSWGKAIWGAVGQSVITQASQIIQKEIDKRTPVIVEGGDAESPIIDDDSEKGLDKEEIANRQKRLYEEYESKAKREYEFLSSNKEYKKGYKTNEGKKDEKGHFTSKKEVSSFKGEIYMNSKKALRSYQNTMRMARNKAKRFGLDIPVSKYETIDVSFN